MQAFDGDRKDDDVLAEEHRVEQSLFQSSNQASMKMMHRATAQHATVHVHMLQRVPCHEDISKGNAVSNRSEAILTLKVRVVLSVDLLASPWPGCRSLQPLISHLQDTRVEMCFCVCTARTLGT